MNLENGRWKDYRSQGNPGTLNHLKSKHPNPIWLSKWALRLSHHNYLCQQRYFWKETWLQGYSNHKPTAPYFTIRHYWSTGINNLSSCIRFRHALSSPYVPWLFPSESFCKPHRLMALLPPPDQCSTRSVAEGNGESNRTHLALFSDPSWLFTHQASQRHKSLVATIKGKVSYSGTYQLNVLGNSLTISMPQFPHPYNRDNQSICLKEILWGFNELIRLAISTHCEHAESINKGGLLLLWRW